MQFVSLESQYKWSKLVSGSNASGFACILNIENIKDNVVLQSILFNCGDSCQQACLQSKIKLQKLSIILISSLSPHNTSGLPGIIFALSNLGNECVKLIGPVGLKGLVDLISQNITKRKYPIIEIIEFGDYEYSSTRSISSFNNCNDDIHGSVNNGGTDNYYNSENIDSIIHHGSLCIHICPVWSTVNGSKAIGVSYYIPSLKVAMIPLDLSLVTRPSTLNIVNTFTKCCHQSFIRDVLETVLFVPLTIAAQLIPIEKIHDNISRVVDMNEIQTILFHGKLTNQVIEFPKSQENLMISNKIYPSLFSPPFAILQTAFQGLEMNKTCINITMVQTITSSTTTDDVAGTGTASDSSVIDNTSDCDSISDNKNCFKKIKLANNLHFIVHLDDSMLDFLFNATSSNRQNISSSALFSSTSINASAVKCYNNWDKIQKSMIQQTSSAIINDSTINSDNNTDNNCNKCGIIDNISDRNSADIEHDKNYQAANNIKMKMFSKNKSIIEKKPFYITNNHHETSGDVNDFNTSSTKINTNNNTQEYFFKCIKVPPPTPFDIEVSFLGTGSASPSTLRSNSSIFIKIPISTLNSTMKYKIIVLDTGEGVCRQLFQSVSGVVDRYYYSLLNICIIWLSHHHGDHISGFLHLLQQIFLARYMTSQNRNNGNNSNDNSMEAVPNDKILVICPSTVLPYLQYCVDISGLDDLIQFMSTTDTLYTGCTKRVRQITNGVLNKLTSVNVLHCKESYAVVLEIKKLGFHNSINNNSKNEYYKIVYSGDCRPSQSLVTVGYGCDLLIHEATFSDNLYEQAVMKRHCTTSEALSIGKNMNAKNIILTHFSQRFAVCSETEIKSETQTKLQSKIDNKSLNQLSMSIPSIEPITQSSTYLNNFLTMNTDQDSLLLANTVNVSPPPPSSPFALAFDFLKFAYPSHCKNMILDIASRDIAQAYTICHSNITTSTLLSTELKSTIDEDTTPIT